MGAPRQWTEELVPDQSGRTAVVTGAGSGIGFETARALARRGAHVVLAVRDVDKAAAAVSRIRDTAAAAGPAVLRLDLANQASVREAAKELNDRFGAIDLLINNAGVMWTPESRTADGFELQFATNHLGHFALTGLLLDALRARPGARIVTISSYLHKLGRIDFDDLNAEHRYGRYRAYNRSKLANVMFALELQRRLAESGADTVSLAAHPGLAATGLGRHIPAALRTLGRPLAPLFLQHAGTGMLAGLRAATDPAARGGEFHGPLGPTGTRGPVGPARPGRGARDPHARGRLWAESERLTGVRYTF
ncbi:oxidoreductase [Streptomyces sp. NBC_01754]|uniref:oxidoreductase n=1 Tax=Streptomyces sp. NBC_01754 TaxID=2975930 RepID=UPI002DD8653E|nr:oxidoreductase [Streptomyces sp. NBC_01754]WSC90944.1 oxidoreductase [Streptomyces sp. NBC_01754]WSC96562.1 oxidoreductase [Streptomyces sp. NBC_01754]